MKCVVPSAELDRSTKKSASEAGRSTSLKEKGEHFYKAGGDQARLNLGSRESTIEKGGSRPLPEKSLRVYGNIIRKLVRGNNGGPLSLPTGSKCSNFCSTMRLNKRPGGGSSTSEGRGKKGTRGTNGLNEIAGKKKSSFDCLLVRKEKKTLILCYRAEEI